MKNEQGKRKYTVCKGEMSDMDTKKALIVILILLILMNVGLASYIIVYSTGNIEVSDMADYTEEILKERNISLNCRIPDSGPAASTVTLGNMLYTENSIDTLSETTGGSYSIDVRGRLIFVKTPGDEIVSEVMNRTAVEGISHDYISSIGLQNEDFALDYVIETGTDEYEVRYLRKDSSDVLYYDSYIEMTITEAGVIYAEIYIRDIQEKGNISIAGLPIQTILLANLINEDNEIVIESINFGYHRAAPDLDESVMSWRIRFDDGSERFFEVGNGKEITPEMEILEFNNIRFECAVPKSFDFKGSIIYGESGFTPEMLNSMLIFMNGKAEIDSSGLITYIRTSYDNVTYNLTQVLAGDLSVDFITNIGLDPQEFYLDSIVLAEDGSYDLFYIMTDADGTLYFDNFININIKRQGVAFASFRYNTIEPGTGKTEPWSIGSILLDNLETDTGQEYTVTEIKAGYKKDTDGAINAYPCWRITFKDGSVRYFSAANNGELASE
jgi:hypothetical protein